jgi:hypothetical protein
MEVPAEALSCSLLSAEGRVRKIPRLFHQIRYTLGVIATCINSLPQATIGLCAVLSAKTGTRRREQSVIPRLHVLCSLEGEPYARPDPLPHRYGVHPALQSARSRCLETLHLERNPGPSVPPHPRRGVLRRVSLCRSPVPARPLERAGYEEERMNETALQQWYFHHMKQPRPGRMSIRQSRRIIGLPSERSAHQTSDSCREAKLAGW